MNKNPSSDKENHLLYQIYQKIVEKGDALEWSYFKGGHLEGEKVSRTSDYNHCKNYAVNLGNLSMLVSKRADDSIRLIVSSSEGPNTVTLYDASGNFSINTIYSYLEMRRLYEEKHKLKHEVQERCAPLEQLLIALEQPAKKTNGKKRAKK